MFATKIGTSGSGRRWRLAAITVPGTEGMPYYENHPARGTRRRVNTATMAGEGITAAQETERLHFHLLICLPFHDWKQQAVELLAGTRFPHMIYDDAWSVLAVAEDHHDSDASW